MDLVLIGPPGAGKGTQAEGLCARHGLLHLAAGDLLRQAVAAGTALGQKARRYVETGELVPDRLVADLLAERLGREEARAGVLLDGFPRTVEQVQLLDEVLRQFKRTLTAVLDIEIADAEAVRRLSGRRICKACGAIYNLDSQPSRRPGVCDSCGGDLIQREDDREEVIRRRLQLYRQKTVPLLEIYRKRGLLRTVDGNRGKQSTGEQIDRALAEVKSHG